MLFLISPVLDQGKKKTAAQSAYYDEAPTDDSAAESSTEEAKARTDFKPDKCVHCKTTRLDLGCRLQC